jgi:hypothetical protein
MDCNFGSCYNRCMPSIPLSSCPTCLAKVTVILVDFATQRRFCHVCATTSSTAVTVARKTHEHNMRGTLEEYPVEERRRDLLGGDGSTHLDFADTPHT